MATLTGTTEDAALLAAARYGLDELRPTVPVEATAAEAVLARARFDRLSGFLAAAVLAGAVQADDDSVWSPLWQQWHEELLACVRLEALVVRTAELLDRAGIRWRLTKGAALAHLDYPEPSVRTFGDVDIIVHPSDWSAAFTVLTTSGYRREAPTLPCRYDDRYGKGATLTTEDGFEIDLHRRFAIGRFGVTAKMEALFTSSDTLVLADRDIPVLDTSGRLLHACFHAALGGFRGWRAFRDVAQLILMTGADWEASFEIARTWKAEAVVSSAIAESWSRLELDADHPAHTWAVSATMSRGDRRVLELFAQERGFRSQAMTAIRRLPPQEVPRYLWILGHPRLRRQA
jgi:hypothetical protein